MTNCDNCGSDNIEVQIDYLKTMEEDGYEEGFRFYYCNSCKQNRGYTWYCRLDTPVLFPQFPFINPDNETTFYKSTTTPHDHSGNSAGCSSASGVEISTDDQGNQEQNKMNKDLIEVSDRVKVRIIGMGYTLSSDAEVLNVPRATGESWGFKDVHTGEIMYTTEGVTIFLLEKSKQFKG